MTVTFQEPPADLQAITNEKAFTSLVIDALRTLGWVVIWLDDARVSEVGIPDLMCFRDGRGEMIELKIGRKPLSAGQVRWQMRRLPEGTYVHLMRNTDKDWQRIMALMT